MNTNDLYYLNEDNHKKSTGGSGVKVHIEPQTPSGITATSGTYYAIHFLTDCTPTAFTATSSELSTNVTYPSGTVIYCNVTQIQCTADQAFILYKC